MAEIGFYGILVHFITYLLLIFNHFGNVTNGNQCKVFRNVAIQFHFKQFELKFKILDAFIWVYLLLFRISLVHVG